MKHARSNFLPPENKKSKLKLNSESLELLTIIVAAKPPTPTSTGADVFTTTMQFHVVVPFMQNYSNKE